jgi:hypothetical protein
VRESAVFSGIPITERLAEEERTCARRGETIALFALTSGNTAVGLFLARPPIRRRRPATLLA